MMLFVDVMCCGVLSSVVFGVRVFCQCVCLSCGVAVVVCVDV